MRIVGHVEKSRLGEAHILHTKIARIHLGQGPYLLVPS